MGLRRTVAPAKLPVSLPELAANIKTCDIDEEKVYLDGLLATAIGHVEKLTRRQLITATWRYTLDRFPVGNCPLWLPRPRLQSLTVAYVDGDGATQTWDASLYRLDTESEPARIEPAFGQSWPVTRRVTNAVTITMVCGYGDEATSVPDNLKHAIKIVGTRLYECRGADLDAMPTVDALVADQVIDPALFLDAEEDGEE
jgi:uncharacterized phiE125 gp8 family phage protein